jgi:hypothetical protein
MMKRLLHVVTKFTARFALLCGFGLASLVPLYAQQSTEQLIDSTAANTAANQTTDSGVPAAPTPQSSSNSVVTPTPLTFGEPCGFMSILSSRRKV